jgi:hypothetical protein
MATPETQTLTFGTRPAVFMHGLQYQRITEVCSPDEVVQVTVAEPIAERRLELPLLMASRIMKAAVAIRAGYIGEGHRYNCHQFVRSLYGLDDGDYPQDPFVINGEGLPEVTRLPLGVLGIHWQVRSERVGCWSRYDILHSVVGLGEDEPDALQVISSDGEFGFAGIQETLDWDRRNGAEVRFCQLTDGWTPGPPIIRPVNLGE